MVDALSMAISLNSSSILCTPQLEELHASVPDPEYNRKLDMPSDAHSMYYTKKIIDCLKAYRAPPSCKRLPTFTLSAGYKKTFFSQTGPAPGEYEILPSDVRDWDMLESIIEQVENEDEEADEALLWAWGQKVDMKTARMRTTKHIEYV